jgi:hypothetical protein
VGTIGEHLEKITPAVQNSRSGGFHEDTINDSITEVSIDVQDQPLRHVLTHCVDLDTYGRVICLASD